MKKILVLSLVLAMFVCSFAGRPAPQPSTTVTIPVLCYHVIGESSSRYSASLASFKEQMAYLNSNGYTTLSADEYYNIMSGTATAPSKPILLTFDDATVDFYTNAYPVLKQYGMHAIAFVVSGWIDTAGHLTSSQIQTLSTAGIDIENHTVSHDRLQGATYDQQYAEIKGCNDKILAITGKASLYTAYPNGVNDTNTITVQTNLGMRMGFKVGNGMTTPAQGFFELGRNMIVRSDSLTSFIGKIS
jgi:peptidoglycan/xylan/chitin deacetylase (PgdA/CDA1 family)